MAEENLGLLGKAGRIAGQALDLAKTGYNWAVAPEGRLLKAGGLAGVGGAGLLLYNAMNDRNYPQYQAEQLAAQGAAGRPTYNDYRESNGHVPRRELERDANQAPYLPPEVALKERLRLQKEEEKNLNEGQLINYYQYSLGSRGSSF